MHTNNDTYFVRIGCLLFYFIFQCTFQTRLIYCISLPPNSLSILFNMINKLMKSSISFDKTERIFYVHAILLKSVTSITPRPEYLLN